MKKVARWGILIVAIIVAALIHGIWRQMDQESGGGFITGALRGVLITGFLIWVWYATKKLEMTDGSTHTQLVKQAKPLLTASAELSVDAKQSSVPSQPQRSSPAAALITPIEILTSHQSTTSDEDLWAHALSEIETDNKKPGVWGKAFALSEGEEPKARAKYLQLRVDQLIAERNSQLEARRGHLEQETTERRDLETRRRVEYENASGVFRQIAKQMKEMTIGPNEMKENLMVRGLNEIPSSRLVAELFRESRALGSDKSLDTNRDTEAIANAEKQIKALTAAGFKVDQTAPGVWQCQKAGRGTILAQSITELEYAVRMISDGKW